MSASKLILLDSFFIFFNLFIESHVFSGGILSKTSTMALYNDTKTISCTIRATYYAKLNLNLLKNKTQLS